MKPNKKKINLDRLKVHEIDLGELKETVDNVVNKFKEKEKKFEYKLIVWRTNGKTEISHHTEKPNFKLLYKKLKCRTIEMLRGKYYTISERVFDIYCDGDSKLKEPHYRNVKATDAWLRWQGIAHTQSLPGDFIAGDTGIILKMKKKMKETEDYELSMEEK